ncbi:hypothetical protein ECFRIK1996_2345, partial [Escherichia coli FRIK1996]
MSPSPPTENESKGK